MDRIAIRVRPSFREQAAFTSALLLLLTIWFHPCLLGDKILSPADALKTTRSFQPARHGEPFEDIEPEHRLLMDPVLQFEPWRIYSWESVRDGELPFWNDDAGFGAPFLSNGQCAVFDPFQGFAYFCTTPDGVARSIGFSATARLLAAGWGMFHLCAIWGFRRPGRWFAGLVFPLTGFLIGWLLYPPVYAAIWLPWIIAAGENALSAPRFRPRAIAVLGLFVGLSWLGGHIQTTAHSLLLLAAYACWRFWEYAMRPDPTRSEKLRACGLAAAQLVLGTALGIFAGMVVIAPQAEYLAESPVWADRAEEFPPFTEWRAPRVKELACVVFPYMYGSQRKGHPNLARALGVQNLNESAGSFAGLATIALLVPWSRVARRRVKVTVFLMVVTGFGLLAAYQAPVADNLLRAIPIIKVMDHRRLTLWVAWGLALLGGIGLDHWHCMRRIRPWRGWRLILLAAAAGLAVLAVAARFSEPWVAPRIIAHYARTAAETPGADPLIHRQRALRQIDAISHWQAWYYAQASVQLIICAGLITIAGRPRGDRVVFKNGARFGIVLLIGWDLWLFGAGLNPTIPLDDFLPHSEAIDWLQKHVGTSGRILGLGEEMLPNTLMRYGLQDTRNYDSVEMANVLLWLEPLFEKPDHPPNASTPVMRTSRRDVTWSGVARARELLRNAGVRAVVAAEPPPAAEFPDAHPVSAGAAWILPLPDAAPLWDSDRPGTRRTAYRAGRWIFQVPPLQGRARDEFLRIRVSSSPGWSAVWQNAPDAPGGFRDGPDGQTPIPSVPATITPYETIFWKIPLRDQGGTLRVEYVPRVWRWASRCAAVAWGLIGLGIVSGGLPGPPRFPNLRDRLSRLYGKTRGKKET